MGLKFLHTSDWQLGLTRHFFSPEAQARYTDDQIAGIRRMVEIAGEQSCGFVVVAGDVFDSPRPTRTVLARAGEALAGFGVPVYVLPGNHDARTPAALWHDEAMAKKLPEQVHVLADATPVVVEGVGVELVGAPWPTRKPDRDLLQDALDGLDPPVSGVARVAVGHGVVDKLDPDRLNPAAISLGGLVQALEAGTVSYVALGDRHSLAEVTTGVWYSGAPLATDFREQDPNKALVVSIEGETVTVEPIDVGGWRFVIEEFQLSDNEDVDTVAMFLDGLEEKERTVVKLGLVGAIGLSARARLDDVLDHARDLFAGVVESNSRSDLVVIADNTDLAALDLSGFAAAALGELAEKAAGDTVEAGAARDALLVLHRLHRRRS